MPESFHDCFFLLLWSSELFATITLGKVIVITFNDTARPFDLRYIQMRYVKSILFLYLILNFLICSLVLSAGQIKLIHIHLYIDVMFRFREFVTEEPRSPHVNSEETCSLLL